MNKLSDAAITDWHPPLSIHGTGCRSSLPQLSSSQPLIPAIPFTGLFLSDLVFNAELPDYLNPNDSKLSPLRKYRDLSSPSFRDSSSSTSSSSPHIKYRSMELINFHKHRTTAAIIKRFCSFQDSRRTYPIEQDVNAYSKCLFLRTLDNDTLKELTWEYES